MWPGESKWSGPNPEDRGTLQSTTLDMIRDGDDKLADWLTAVCQPLPKAECKSINYFVNINSGRKSGKGWHHDNPISHSKAGHGLGRTLRRTLRQTATDPSPPPISYARSFGASWVVLASAGDEPQLERW
jgi:hypothetical protein